MDKKYTYQTAEQAIQQQWEQDNVFAFDAADQSKEIFSIDTPPPTVSGSLHIGHIFSYTHTDIIARYQRLTGKRVFYPLGFDDNGLPTERYVEKKAKTSPFKIGRPAFIDLCLKETEVVEEQFKKLWESIGLSVDWQLSYSTIEKSVRKISQESFVRLLDKGYIYRRFEPALYCTACRTSVAQAELDDIEQPSQFTDLAFSTEDGSDLVIGTTRPELLSSCVALLYHPEDARYTHLAGKQAIVPIYGNQVPILADVLVQQDKGTGLVMCCTFGDKNDIAWFKKHNLPYKQSIGLTGKWTEDTGILAGLKAPDARKTILAALEEAGVIRGQKNITHPVNVHERCKRPIEYVVLSQWFLNILEHKQKFLELAEQINWSPAYMKSRYINWVENLSWDWCLSRQRYYGIPFPVWHCVDCKEIIVAPIDSLPIDPQEQQPPAACTCGSTNLIADTDVMDTWNTSSLTPEICYGLFNPEAKSVFEKQATDQFLPMSMRPQAHDIIRTWAFYTIIKAWMHYDSLPWKDIVISGHVLSSGNEKISKSKGNAPLAPENLLKKWPADVIRFWTASGALGTDVAFSENQLKIGQRLTTKLWNAFWFVHEHIAQVDPAQKPAELGVVNEWLINNVNNTYATYKKSLDNYEFSGALNAIERFFWADFCDNYLEVIKDQLFNPDKYPAEQVAATQWTLYTVGLRILQMYAPLIPHITDTIYREIYAKHVGAPSLHVTDFSQVQSSEQHPESAKTMAILLDAIGAVRKLKTNQQLSLKTPIALLTIHGDAALQEKIKPHEALILGVSQADSMAYSSDALTENLLNQDGETWNAAITIHDTVAKQGK